MSSPKVALISGITGQDGAYLSSFLLEKGYIVHGIKRRSSSFNTGRIDPLLESEKYSDRFFLHHGDLTDCASLFSLFSEIAPDEVYNLGAQSHVGVSFDLPNYSLQVNAAGTLNLLEAIKSLGRQKDVKFYQASTSELYGQVREELLNEETYFRPCSPYSIAKLYAYWITKNYRESYGLFACNGVVFNHESPLRGETFITRKITRGMAKLKAGTASELVLGNHNSLV